MVISVTSAGFHVQRWTLDGPLPRPVRVFDGEVQPLSSDPCSLLRTNIGVLGVEPMSYASSVKLQCTLTYQRLRTESLQRPLWGVGGLG